MRKTNAAPILTEPAHYEAALQELEKLVLELEGGQMPLDQLLAGYQRGAQLLAYCRDKGLLDEATFYDKQWADGRSWEGGAQGRPTETET